jgi:hypothetical protein
VKVTKRDLQLIVSVTTVPERIDRLHLTIESLFRQSLKPDRIILWLDDALQTEASTGQQISHIPTNLQKLVPRGLEISFTRDIGPFTSTISSLKAFPRSIIVTADDDVYYPKNWLKDLWDVHLRHPEGLICHQARLMIKKSARELAPYDSWGECFTTFSGPTANIFPLTKGGLLIPPGVFKTEVFNETVFMDLCPKQDDAWLKTMALYSKVACLKVRPKALFLIPIRGSQSRALLHDNIIGGKNDSQVKALFDKYDLYQLIE